MLKTLLARRIAAFEKRWDYDAAYMRDLLEAGPWTFIRFGLVTSLGRSRDAPAAAIAAANIVATLAEDCGPCTQISVDIASASGVKPEILRAILAGDREGMGETAALGHDFARAVIDRNLADADEVRDKVARVWGARAVTSLALAVTTARMYPTLKYGLGHGLSCSRVTVAGVSTPFRLAEPVAV